MSDIVKSIDILMYIVLIMSLFISLYYIFVYNDKDKLNHHDDDDVKNSKCCSLSNKSDDRLKFHASNIKSDKIENKKYLLKIV